MIRDYRNVNADNWFYSLINSLESIPFSFTYDQKVYHGFSSEYFKIINKDIKKINNKENVIINFLFLNSLIITLDISHYYTHGVSEFTVYFENNKEENSKVIEDVKVKIDLKGQYPILKGILGDHKNQYSPYSVDLRNNYVEFSSDSGRATHINFPYFNLEYDNEGMMLAIGWAGTWNAKFYEKSGNITYEASSVNGLKTYLKPNEKIRTALFVFAMYGKRDEHYATNYWRDWFIKYNLPKKDKEGNDLEPFSTCCLACDSGLPNSDGSISERYTTWKPSLEKMIEEDVKVDFRWFDAGWYVRPNLESEETDWWGSVGTWVLDPKKWPDKTFLESVEFSKKNNINTIVWFEPERVTDPLNLEKNFNYDSSWAISLEDENAISNNIGNKDCFNWTVNQISKMLKDNKVSMYREDNNCNASKLWKHLDFIEGENRKGITECKFIDAHYRMWDEFIKVTLENDGCGFVDSCASGGGRNDLESMRRGVPLLRSDSDRTSSSLRLSMTTSFNKWIPFNGAHTKEKIHELDATGVSDTYVFRASYLPALNVSSQFVQDPNQDFSILRNGIKEWKKVSPYLLKEFYTLTPWHKEKDNSNFTAFAYFDPLKEKGVLFAFRQEECEINSLKVTLPFISEKESVKLIDEDSKEEIIYNNFLDIKFASKREAKLFWIEVKDEEIK